LSQFALNTLCRCVHQTVTVRQLSVGARVRTEGYPTDQDTWFPGYAWTILYCRVCRNHLGWHFTSTDPAIARRLRSNSNHTNNTFGFAALQPREGGTLLDRLNQLITVLRGQNNANADAAAAADNENRRAADIAAAMAMAAFLGNPEDHNINLNVPRSDPTNYEEEISMSEDSADVSDEDDDYYNEHSEDEEEGAHDNGRGEDDSENEADENNAHAHAQEEDEDANWTDATSDDDDMMFMTPRDDSIEAEVADTTVRDNSDVGMATSPSAVSGPDLSQLDVATAAPTALRESTQDTVTEGAMETVSPQRSQQQPQPVVDNAVIDPAQLTGEQFSDIMNDLLPPPPTQTQTEERVAEFW
jgi:hypothetical protein